MNKTASLVMKIVGASLAFAAVVCLIIGNWTALSASYGTAKARIKTKLSPAEAAHYDDEEVIC